MRPDARLCIEGRDLLDVGLFELEIEDAAVFQDTLPVDGLGNGDDSELEIPAQQDLRRGSFVLRRDPRDDRIVQAASPCER